MAKDNRENTVFSGSERAPIKWITLPDDLAKWVDQNQELVERVQNALADTYDTLTEEQLWGVVAATCSPEWQEARTNLQRAEDLLADLNSPEKASLGLIGNALDSDENNAARTQFAFSQAYFTIVDEGLRKREDLGRLLKVMLVQKRMLDSSADRTQQLQKATAGLAALSTLESAFLGAKNQKTAREVSAEKNRAQEKKSQELSGLSNAFKKYAGKLLKPKKERAPTSGPVPSSPKT